MKYATVFDIKKMEDVNKFIGAFIRKRYPGRMPDWYQDRIQDCWMRILQYKSLEKAKNWGYIAACIRSTLCDMFDKEKTLKRGYGYFHTQVSEKHPSPAPREVDGLELDDYFEGMPPAIPLIRANKIMKERARA